MYIVVMYYNIVIFFDCINIGRLEIDLFNGECWENDDEFVLKKDCIVYLVMFDLSSNLVWVLWV